jgi:hypothetical protein
MSPNREQIDILILATLRKQRATSAELVERTGLRIDKVRESLRRLLNGKDRMVEQKIRWLGHHSHTWVYQRIVGDTR